MFDKKGMAHARECVRLAGLTDDQEVRDQLIDLARDWIVAARRRRKKKKKKEKEEDNNSNVLVFPSAVERSRRHGLRMSLRHAITGTTPANADSRDLREIVRPARYKDDDAHNAI
jgi:reverse gyrase